MANINPQEAFVLVENGGQPPSIYLAELLLQNFLLSVSDWPTFGPKSYTSPSHDLVRSFINGRREHSKANFKSASDPAAHLQVRIEPILGFLAVYFSAYVFWAKPDQENNYNYYWPNLVFKKQTELWLQLLVLMSLLNLEWPLPPVIVAEVNIFQTKFIQGQVIGVLIRGQ